MFISRFILISTLQIHLDSRNSDRKRSAKEWLANAKYLGGDIKPLLDDLYRQFRILEKSNVPMETKETGYILMRIIPSSRDRNIDGVKSSLSRALIRGESPSSPSQQPSGTSHKI